MLDKEITRRNFFLRGAGIVGFICFGKILYENRPAPPVYYGLMNSRQIENESLLTRPSGYSWLLDKAANIL